LDLGQSIYASTILQEIELPKIASLALFSAYKNVGLAAAVALKIFSPQAAMPAAVYILARNGSYTFLAALRRFSKFI
jgi:predicted Na+-dependent transporter